MLMSAAPGEYLPSFRHSHSLTRNRTRGSDFFPFSSLAWKIPTIIVHCFRAHFLPGKALLCPSRAMSLFMCLLIISVLLLQNLRTFPR